MDVEPVQPRFTDVISSPDQLEAVLGTPNAGVIAKVIPSLDDLCRRFIARSPFILVGSSDSEGNIDVSPKGDPPGFVQVLDDTTLALPERPGNRRADTFRNVLQNPNVGLIFLVPGKRETLRVSGKAMIVRDIGLRQSMTLNGRIPKLAMVVSVREAFFHCAKCMIRSHLWEPVNWLPLDGLPTLAEVAVAHARLAETIEAVQARIDTDETTKLY